MTHYAGGCLKVCDQRGVLGEAGAGGLGEDPSSHVTMDVFTDIAITNSHTKHHQTAVTDHHYEQ